MGELGGGVSRDETVDIVTSYYNFLATFPYLPPSEIQKPPSGGWPESDKEYLQKLGKTDAVVDLLTHLRYIGTRDWHVGYDTQPLHYAGLHVKGALDHGFTLERALLSPQHEKIPPHVVALTYGETYGSWLLFDTENDTITDYSLLGGKQPNLDQDVYDSGMAWTHFPKMPTKEFFESWKAKLMSLEWIPVPNKNGKGGRVWAPGAHKEGDLEEIRKIYHDHDWPGSQFLKDKCRAALQEWVKNWEKKLTEEFNK